MLQSDKNQIIFEFHRTLDICSFINTLYIMIYDISEIVNWWQSIFSKRNRIDFNSRDVMINKVVNYGC
jgi:hypothetical protein